MSYFENQPLAIITVTINGKEHQVVINKNDDIKQIATDFCQKFSLDQNKVPSIIKIIEEEIQKNQQEHELFQKKSSRNFSQADLAKNYESWHKLIRQKQNEQTKKKNKTTRSNTPQRTPLKSIRALSPKIVRSPVEKNYSFKQVIKPLPQPKSQPKPNYKQQQEFLNRVNLNQKRNQNHVDQMRQEMIESIHYEHQPKIRKDSYYEKAKKKSDEEDQKLCKKLNIRFRQVSKLYKKQESKTGLEKEKSKKQLLSLGNCIEIFQRMDIDQDGYISYESMNLCNIPGKQLELIQEILFKLEDHNLRLDQQDFINECKQRRLIVEEQEKELPKKKTITGPLTSRYQKLVDKQYK